MQAPYTTPSNVARDFIRTLEANPEGPALEMPSGRSVDRRELSGMVRAAAGRLADQGVEAGDRVLLQVPSGPLFVAATTGAIWLGAVPVLIAPSVGRSVYRRMVEQVEPDHAWVHPIVEGANAPIVSSVVERLGADIPPVGLDWESREVVVEAHLRGDGGDRPPLPPPSLSVDEDADAVIVFSGGTGGDPKGARLSHGAIGQYVDNIGTVLEEMPHSERVLVDTPQQMLCTLLLGKTAVPTPNVGRIDYILEAIRSSRADTYFGSPYTWRQLRERAEPNPETLPSTFRTVLLGSAPITGPLLRELDDWLHDRAEVKCLYGTTEAGPVCSARLEEKLAWEGAGNYVGSPIEGVSIDVGADDPSAAGEVLVDSPALFSGYVGEFGRTSRPFETGDVGRLVGDSERALVLVGRSKDLIVSRGTNVYPYAAERALEEALDESGEDWLEACAMVGLDRPEVADEMLVLAVEIDGSVAGDWKSEVESVLGEVAGRRAVPHRIVAFDELPVTGRQRKLDRGAIREEVDRRIEEENRA